MCDANPHLIEFYSIINSNNFNPESVKSYLTHEGAKLHDTGPEHYYHIRERFNIQKHPLDFLFINRACFNGMIRFNKKGGINIPFCHKNNRFSKTYITKICNQIDKVKYKFSQHDFIFKFQDFKNTIASASSGDLIYCDPPYIGRHTDYYNGWNEDDEEELFNLLSATKAKFMLSTWHHNDFRENIYIDKYWSKFNIVTREHFYHVGAKETNRHGMTEALITNYEPDHTQHPQAAPRPVQAALFG